MLHWSSTVCSALGGLKIDLKYTISQRVMNNEYRRISTFNIETFHSVSYRLWSWTGNWTAALLSSQRAWNNWRTSSPTKTAFFTAFPSASRTMWIMRYWWREWHETSLPNNTRCGLRQWGGLSLGFVIHYDGLGLKQRLSDYKFAVGSVAVMSPGYTKDEGDRVSDGLKSKMSQL